MTLETEPMRTDLEHEVLCDALAVDPVPGWMPRLATTSMSLDALGDMDWLSAADRRMASRFQHEKRLRDFLLGRRAAYAAIHHAFPRVPTSGFHIERGVFDQPVWTGQGIPALSLSIAHCDGVGTALVARAGFTVGLDLERVNDHQSETMDRQMTETEREAFRAALPDLSRAERLTTLWCAKEALSKAIGCGLTCPMEVMEVGSVERADRCITGTFHNFYQYRFHAWRHSKDMILAIVMHRHHRLNFTPDGVL